MPVSYFFHGVIVPRFITLDARLERFLIPICVQRCDTFRDVNQVAQCPKLTLGCPEHFFALGGDCWCIEKKLPRIGQWQAIHFVLFLCTPRILLRPFVSRSQ